MDDFRVSQYKRDIKKNGEIIKDGQCVARIDFRPDPLTGEQRKPKYITSTLPGRKGEQDLKRKLTNTLEKLRAGDLSSIDTLTVSGWMEKYFEIYCTKLATTTLEGYKRYVDKLINPVIGKVKLYELRPMHIENLYNQLRKKDRGIDEDGNEIKREIGKIGYSEKTLLQIHRILHRAFKKAVGDSKMLKNPCDGVDAPSPEEYEPTIYTEEQFADLLDKLEGHRMEALILIAGMCGLRRGELLGLTWDDIDFENNTINIHNNRVPTKEEGVIEKEPKSKKSKRIFTIPSIIMPALKRCRGIGKLYVRLDGEEYHPGSVSSAFSEFLAKNELPHIRLHDMRHFNATMMLKNGVSEREAMERTGHSNANMLKKYQHILKEMDKKSADKLNNVLKKKKNKIGAKIGAKA
jgi:integrase